MKKIFYTYISFACLSISLNSCQLTEDLDDYKPLYSLDAETAINTQETAELALVGAYATFRQSTGGGTPDLFIIPDILSGYSNSGRFGTSPEELAFVQNTPLATGTNMTIGAYKRLYDLVNRANWMISSVEKLDESVFTPTTRKNEIIAEGKILRALGHFYLLRTFGQFYDINSVYGVNVRLEPARSAVAQPRNTVKETYDFILADLNYGIAQAPDFRTKKYTNKTFAKALKAKVFLYMGKYDQAAETAKEIIAANNANFKLETTYPAIFSDHTTTAIFDKSEILFGTSGDASYGIGMGNFYSGIGGSVLQKYLDEVAGKLTINGQEISIDGDKRAKALFVRNVSYGGYYSTKYSSFFTVGKNEMLYHMRMAEVYLILAEAEARANNTVTAEALNAINTIRQRAGATTGSTGFVTYPASIGLQDFLTAVRFEKLAEIYQEGGENWFDLIRYDYADGFESGFKVSDVKPTATDPNKYILPIPTESIDSGGKVVSQNPGYN